ncbi:RnlB-A RNA ligase 2 [Reticulomyxa filosa]|uniref:RnlB-A RNA ligase 2 n=1 Tax=Reticulomyxa filosa TaxID=46433 RepID=X6NUY1_RETFI|nr:RnlB-A RNA ligase 2 [Reticulomyxa filosa]|eukprot:ETO29077.1 RnlB-A RNA ligase 2 [Reticulomyxa filosa]
MCYRAHFYGAKKYFQLFKKCFPSFQKRTESENFFFVFVEQGICVSVCFENSAKNTRTHTTTAKECNSLVDNCKSHPLAQYKKCLEWRRKENSELFSKEINGLAMKAEIVAAGIGRVIGLYETKQDTLFEYFHKERHIFELKKRSQMTKRWIKIGAIDPIPKILVFRDEKDKPEQHTTAKQADTEETEEEIETKELEGIDLLKSFWNMYPSIENHFNKREVNDLIAHGHAEPDVEWVACEKVHGTNFTILTDGTNFVAAR